MGASGELLKKAPASAYGVVIRPLRLERHSNIALVKRGINGRDTPKVSVAEDADAALEYLEHQPDVTLMFTDVVMSGSMNGDELARIARARHPGLKVLFTSGYTQDAFMSDGRLEPGIDLLVKPYRREALQQKLNEILAG